MVSPLCFCCYSGPFLMVTEFAPVEKFLFHFLSEILKQDNIKSTSCADPNSKQRLGHCILPYLHSIS